MRTSHCGSISFQRVQLAQKLVRDALRFLRKVKRKFDGLQVSVLAANNRVPETIIYDPYYMDHIIWMFAGPGDRGAKGYGP